ncbi:MAG: hypothetical protein J6K32_08250 [Clostridia bacterium]|nr:hypothetical protein [Clostridia bacterium]
MSEKEKEIGKRLAEAFDALPAGSKEYFLGVADGIALMHARKEQEKTEEEKSA